MQSDFIYQDAYNDAASFVILPRISILVKLVMPLTSWNKKQALENLV